MTDLQFAKDIARGNTPFCCRGKLFTGTTFVPFSRATFVRKQTGYIYWQGNPTSRDEFETIPINTCVSAANYSSSATLSDAELRSVRAVARALIGGGGGGVYIHIFVLCPTDLF